MILLLFINLRGRELTKKKESEVLSHSWIYFLSQVWAEALFLLSPSLAAFSAPVAAATAWVSESKDG